MTYLQAFSLALILTGNFLLRRRFRRQPLDWDHGTYGYLAYWYRKLGRNIIPGVTGNPGLISYSKPGQSYIFWVIVGLCGTDSRKIRDFDSVWYLANTLGVFCLGKAAFGIDAGLASAAIYAFYSSLPFSWTADLNPENYQTLFVTLSVASFIVYTGTGSTVYLVTSGLAGFLSMLMKQTAAPYYLGYFAWIGFFVRDAGQLTVLTATFAVPYIFIIGFYAMKGYDFKYLLSNFLILPTRSGLSYVFNTIEEGGEWVKTKEASLKWKQLVLNLKAHMLESSALWFLGIAGLTLLAASPAEPMNFVMLTVFAGMIVGYIVPQKFYPYYFIPFISLLSVVVGGLVTVGTEGTEFLSGWVSYGMVFTAATLFIISVPRLRRYFFGMTPQEQAVYQYRHSVPSFLASEEIAEYVRERTEPEDYIFAWSINPEIYFLSERRSAIGFLSVDSDFMRRPGWDWERLVRHIERNLVLNKAKYVILTSGELTIETIMDLTGLRYELEKLFETYLPGAEDRRYPVYRLDEKSYEDVLVGMGEKVFKAGETVEAEEIFLP